MCIRDSHETDSRNAAQAITLLEAIETHCFDALMGGARRDEEKARAKAVSYTHLKGYQKHKK